MKTTAAATTTVSVKDRMYAVVDREPPTPNMKKASPMLEEILYLEGRTGHYHMAYRFSDGEIRIAVSA